MSLPKEPRQKMINMMYLVLTAMLALNVSSEILNAFKTVDKSLQNANGTIDIKNNQIFQSFEEKLKDRETAERAAIWKPKADKARVLSEDIIKYIDDVKQELKVEAGLKLVKGEEQFKEDDLEATTRLFVTGKQERGKELLSKLTAYKKALLDVDPTIHKEFEQLLPIDLTVPKSQTGGSDKEWEYAYFHMTPTVAALTILSKFQNDIKNSEAMVVDYCHRQVGQVEVIYDAFQAFAGTNSQYLMPGQELIITAGVGAFSKAATPSITVDGSSIPLNADGVAEYKTAVSSPGSYTKKINITFKKPDGTTQTLTRDIQYAVGSPTGLSVSADKVKVLYVGLDNDLTISGGSKGAESISAKIDQGNLEDKGHGHYVARVNTPGKAVVTVNSDGKTQSFEFRVKTVPPPVAKIGASAGGTMAVNDMKAQQGVRADLENFVFEGVKFEVTSFVLMCTGPGFEETGPKVVQNQGAIFSSEARQALERCRSRSTVILDRISVSGPGGSQTLNPTVFNLK